MDNEIQTITVGGYPIRAEQAVKMLAEFETQDKVIEEKQKAIKAALLAEMEKHNVLKLETPEMLISYVGKTTREAFDAKTFKAENPDIYDKYTTLTEVKPSIRIKLR